MRLLDVLSYWTDLLTVRALSDHPASLHHDHLVWRVRDEGGLSQNDASPRRTTGEVIYQRRMRLTHLP